MDAETPLIALADEVAAEANADVYLLNGSLERAGEHDYISLCASRGRRPNGMLILVTGGGSADTGYRIARCMQHSYDKFTVVIPGFCKSAGTLLALGAHELVVFDHGELGPLDVQMSKKDEIWDSQSGLTVTTSLTALQTKAFLAFEQFFLGTEARSGYRIKVTTAADIAVKLATGLFAPLYSQLDPMHVGEAARAIQIADEYGTRLIEASGNSSADALRHLITHYPDHGFVIDRAEAEDLFNHVRKPTDAEKNLIAGLGRAALVPLAETVMMHLSSEIAAPLAGDEDAATAGQDTASAQPDRPHAEPRGAIAQIVGGIEAIETARETGDGLKTVPTVPASRN